MRKFFAWYRCGKQGVDGKPASYWDEAALLLLFSLLVYSLVTSSWVAGLVVVGGFGTLQVRLWLREWRADFEED